MVAIISTIACTILIGLAVCGEVFLGIPYGLSVLVMTCANIIALVVIRIINR